MRVLTTVVLLAAAAVTAEAQTPGGSHHAPGQAAGHLEAQRCAESFERIVAEGRGFGMAFPADQNGYPGPMHALELRDALVLTRDQERQIRALQEAMFAESRPKSAALLGAEARLRQLFQRATATEESVRAQVAEVERLRSEVRLVHLLFHLKTRDALTERQRAIYHEQRWAPAAVGR